MNISSIIVLTIYNFCSNFLVRITVAHNMIHEN